VLLTNLNFKDMKKTFYILRLLIVLICFNSCEKVINLDLKNNTPKLVVEGNILLGLDTLIERQEIKLSSSAKYTGNVFPVPVTNATVKVKEGANTYDFSHVGNGIYRSNFTGQINRVYQLIITYDGDTYEGIETLKNGPKLDSLSIVYQDGAFGDDGGDFVAINTKDPADQKNFSSLI